MQGFCVSQLKTPQAHTLRDAMVHCHAACSKAHADYLNTLAMAMDTRANEDDAVTLKRQGRAYAQALTRYTEATMAWLVFLDTHLHPSKTSRAAQGVR